MMTGTTVLRAVTLAFLAAQGAAAADRAEIEAAVQAWQDAFNAGDGMAAAEALFAEDARLHPPDGPIVEGREAIAGYWQAVMDVPVTNLVLQLVDVDILADDAALEIGTWQATVPAEGGGEMQVGGKTLVLWTRGADGSWRMSEDMWNDGN